MCFFQSRRTPRRCFKAFVPQHAGCGITKKLEHDCEIHITHLKPGQIELTMEEIESCLGEFKPKMLQNNQLFEF